jgi:transposase-like protein
MSPQPARYSAEFREGAVSMVAKARSKYPSESAAISAVATELGIRNPETLRRWVRRAESTTDGDQKSAGSSKQNFLKRSLQRSHPIVIGVIVTVVGGLILLVLQFVVKAHNNHPSLTVDQVSLSPGALGSEPNGLTQVIPFKIDVKLLNTGTQLAAINDARLVVQQFVKIPQCSTQGGFGVTGSYRSNMPTDPRPGTVIKIPVSQLVNPNGADRFELLLRSPLTARNGLAVTVYFYRVHVYLDYNAGATPVDLGEILVDLPYDPLWTYTYFWTHYYASHPHYFAQNFKGLNVSEIQNCLIKNSHVLHSILTLPAKRTAHVSIIPPQLAFARSGGS